MLLTLDISNIFFIKSNNPSLKYQRFTASGCEDIGIRNFVLVEKAQLLYRVECKILGFRSKITFIIITVLKSGIFLILFFILLDLNKMRRTVCVRMGGPMILRT